MPMICHLFGLFQARLTKEHRWGSALLSRNHSLEEEFERAKAAVEVTLKILYFNFLRVAFRNAKLHRDADEMEPWALEKHEDSC